MKRIEVTIERRLALEFDATDEEIEMIQKGDIPNRIEKEFDEADWVMDSYQDYAVWDCDEEVILVDWECK